MCRTRRRASLVDFDDACSSSGRIATTPPAPTVQLIGDDVAGEALDRGVVEQSMDVRARQHAQRPVGVGAGIEADAERHDLRQR